MAKMLWKPSQERVKNSNIYRFMCCINERHEKDFSDYEGLYQWSIDNIPDFWQSMWDFARTKDYTTYDHVIDDLSKMPGEKWFSGARLNFAENLLRYRDDPVAVSYTHLTLPTIYSV